MLLKAILEKGYAEAIKPFLAEGGQHLDTTRIAEREMNQTGYRLMEYHRYQDAKSVFHANMKAFPLSANYPPQWSVDLPHRSPAGQV